MITKRRAEYAELFGLPTDPEAIKRYAALAPAHQEALRRVVTAVATAARRTNVPLTLDWWVDDDDDDWKEFVITVDPPGSPRDRLDELYRLSEPLERGVAELNPDQREWRRKNVGMALKL